MTSQTTYRRACFFKVLYEIAQALKVCEYETLALEEGISDWVQSGKIEHLPIEELQRIDYIRQMQNDLSSALLQISKKITGKNEYQIAELEIDEILNTLNLGENKERFMRATSAYQESSALQPAAVHHSSDVLLFFDD
jgi:hypothetical protein